MFHLSATVLLVLIAIGVVQSVLIKVEHGDRIEGDIALYSRTQITTPTAELTIHGIVFDWVGLNQTFTQVLFEINDYSFSSIFEERDFRPPYLESLIASFVDLETKSLIVTMTVYGFTGQTHVEVHPFDSRKSFEPVVYKVTTVNQDRK